MSSLRKTIGPRMTGTLTASASGGPPVTLSWPEAIEAVGTVTYTVTRTPAFAAPVTTTAASYVDSTATGNPVYSVTATDSRGLTSHPAITAGVTLTNPGLVIDTRFAGLSLVQTASYPDGIERRFNGTDAVTGVQFGATSPGLYGGSTPLTLQGIGVNPGTDWQAEVVTNAPGGRTALRVRRTVPHVQVPAMQMAARFFPGAIWSGQGDLYFRVKMFIPSAFPLTSNGQFYLGSIKANGAGENEDRVAWIISRENFNGADRWFSKLVAGETDGTDVGTWTAATPVTPLQDSFFGGGFYNQGAFADGDGLTFGAEGRYVTTELAICLQDVLGRVAGNQPNGYAICASSIGTATDPPINGTGTVRQRVLGRNMAYAFAASGGSGIGIAFPFDIYSTLPIEGLDFYIASLEIFTSIPPDASFVRPAA